MSATPETRPVATPAAKEKPPKPEPDAGALRARYGVIVVLAGLAVVLVAFAAAVIAYSDASGVSTALAPITGVVGTIVGAYFGVQVGASGKAEADEARNNAEDQAKKLAAVAPAPAAAAVLGFAMPPAEPSPLGGGGGAPPGRAMPSR